MLFRSIRENHDVSWGELVVPGLEGLGSSLLVDAGCGVLPAARGVVRNNHLRPHSGARSTSPADNRGSDPGHKGVGFIDLLEAEGEAELGFLKGHISRGQACVAEEGGGGHGAPD
ncbi:hypothetical protein CDV55_100638 [Aspergillus turcosus]|nr:hypothetical protein CDV55_100638 [Aspergillus turcosus]